MLMGNVSGRKEEAGPSGSKDEEGEEYMECAHGEAHVSYPANAPFPESMVQSPPHSPRAYHSPLMFSPQVPIVPIQRPNETIRQNNLSNQNARGNEGMLAQMGIPTMIMWSYGGNHVAVEGSWDNWSRRELLQRSGNDFTLMKVLPSGIYHYRFFVDGQWRYSPELPREYDDMGNIFNVLDLQDYVPDVPSSISASDSPSSPDSSYTSAPFTLEDSNEKLPELPPLLQPSPFDHSSRLKDCSESVEKPLAAVLNHLYVQKASAGRSVLALSTTHRFRSKFVTLMLYKPSKKVKK